MADMTYDQYHKIMNDRFNTGALPAPHHTGTQVLPSAAGRTRTAVNIPEHVAAMYGNADRRMLGQRFEQQPAQLVDANGRYALGVRAGSHAPVRRKTVMDSLSKLNSAFSAGYDQTDGVEEQTPIGAVRDIGHAIGRFTGNNSITDSANANREEFGHDYDASPDMSTGTGGGLDWLARINNNMVDSANANRMAAGEEVMGYPTPTMENQLMPVGSTDTGRLSDEYAVPQSPNDRPQLQSSGHSPDPLNNRVKRADGSDGGYMSSWSGKGNVGGISNQEVMNRLASRRDAAMTRSVKADMANRESDNSALPHMMSYAEALGKTSNGRPKNIYEAMMSMKLAKNVLAQNNKQVRTANRLSNKQEELAAKKKDSASLNKYREALSRQADATIAPKKDAVLLKQMETKRILLKELLIQRTKAATNEERAYIDSQIKAITQGKVAVTKAAKVPAVPATFGLFGGSPEIPAVMESYKF